MKARQAAGDTLPRKPCVRSSSPCLGALGLQLLKTVSLLRASFLCEYQVNCASLFPHALWSWFESASSCGFGVSSLMCGCHSTGLCLPETLTSAQLLAGRPPHGKGEVRQTG